MVAHFAKGGKLIASLCKLGFFFFFMPLPFSMGEYCITAVSMYVHPVRHVRPVCNTNGYHVISFEKIGLLD